MPAAYSTMKEQKFILPDGNTIIKTDTRDIKFAVAYRFNGYPNWYFGKCWRTHESALKSAEDTLKNPNIAEAIVINRIDKKYIYR